MFYQKVSKRSREAMTDFLTRQYRYNTLNSWNRSTSYANNVKLPNLDIPQELQNLAYDVAGGEVEAPDWDVFFARTVTDFYRRTGYHIGFNGRSSGYLVLYEAKANEDGTYSVYLTAKASLRQKEETLSEQIAKLELSIEETQLTDSNEDRLAVKLQPYLDVEQITEAMKSPPPRISSPRMVLCGIPLGRSCLPLRPPRTALLPPNPSTWESTRCGKWRPRLAPYWTQKRTSWN